MRRLFRNIFAYKGDSVNCNYKSSITYKVTLKANYLQCELFKMFDEERTVLFMVSSFTSERNSASDLRC